MITPVIMPKLGEVMEEGEIIRWLKKEGERVEKGEPLLEVATDKANIEVEAPGSGFLQKILALEGEIIPVTHTIAYIAETMGEKIPGGTPSLIKASPRAKKLAKEYNIDLSKIKGTGPGGRIVEEDITVFLKEKSSEKPLLEREEIPLSRIEKVMMKRMEEAKKVPHFYLTMEVDFSRAKELREELKGEFEKKKLHLSFTDILIKSCSQALTKIKKMNSIFADGKLYASSEINIGLAVGTERGLLVPVIKDTGGKSLFQITRDRQQLIEKAREDKLSPEELEGATFTLSNLGMFGIREFFALITPPQITILATGEIKERAMVREGKIEVEPVMEMTLSCDHRVVDGLSAAKFLNEIKQGLENPSLLLINEGLKN